MKLEFGNRQKTLNAYLSGLIGSLLLTLAAFGIVQEKIGTEFVMYFAISTLAIIQLIVQSVFFLRLNVTPAGRWNLLPFLFTLLIIAILVGGSMWIMYHLNYNMG